MRPSRLPQVSLAVVLAFVCGSLFGQVPGTNVNMVSGTTFPDGDPFLQRQNEPSAAVSSRNPQHLLAGANDYRTVDIPMPNSGDEENGDAWLGVFRSIDGGLTWKSTLLPGYPQDTSAVGMASPLKPYGVATDPTVRAGTHGMFYYSGLVFSRNSGPTGVFVATYQDQNNKGNGNPFNYIGASILDTGTSGQFLDKPWLAVDVPRTGSVGSATCNVNGKTFTSGNAYLVYSKFVGNPQPNNPHTQILFASSTNCGKTWSTPQKLSEGFQLNQGTVAAIDPRNGTLYVAWRQLFSGNQPDAILFTSSTDGGRTFAKVQTVYTFAPGTAFDMNGSSTQFRTISLPSMTVDGSGRVWLGFSLRNQGLNGAARIMMMTLAPGAQSWVGPFPADTTAGATYGHQFLPTLNFAYGRLVLTFYDQRDDSTRGILTCSNGTCTETRQPVGDLAANNYINVFNTALSDFGVKTRHTIDVRGAIVDPTAFNGSTLAFPSVRISQYVYGSRPGSQVVEQMQFNPPNFPMFVQGTRPFMGDYLDVAAQTIASDGKGNWSFNVAHSNAAMFHPVWTDNRDVRTPPVTCSNGVCTQDWTQYTPVGSTGGASLYDSTQTRPVCNPIATGSRNQNIYTSQFTEGLYAAFRENSKQKTSGGSLITREFALIVANKTNSTANYRLTITQPAPSTKYSASFLSNVMSTTLDVTVLARSTVSRSLFIIPGAGASLPYPSVTVNVTQIDKVGGSTVAGGLTSVAITNPDITNPDITNPDITNPDITNPDITNPDITNPDIATAEIYNPTVTNPDITNPDITNPDITNPDITNPDITNPDITNPDITNPDISTYMVTNPDITNPDITNPDITNPDITNPDITNPDIAALPSGTTDLTWKITNKGNTTSAYNAKIVASNSFCCPAGSTCSTGQFKCQLVLRKTYPTPVANACSLTVQAQNLGISNIPNPTFTSLNNIGTPDVSPDGGNATLTLGPGEAGRMTLRVFGTPSADQIGSLIPAAVAFGANTNQTVSNISLTIQTTTLPPAFVGVPYSFQLQAVGGIAPLQWSVFTGTLPAGLSLSTGGLISGTPTGPAGTSNPVTFRVIDTPQANGGVQQAAWSTLTFGLEQFNVTNVVVQKLSTGLSFARTGDSVQVTVTVSDLGTITASNVIPSITSSPAGALTCTGPVPPSANIDPGTTQTYTFQCTVGNVSGSVSVSASATGSFNGVSTTTTSSDSSSATLIVDNTPPTITVTATNTAGAYTAGTWSTTPVTVTFACSDSGSGVAPGFPTGNTTVSTTTTVQAVTGNCQDNAGNTATLNFGPVQVDISAPVVTFGSPAPAANVNGWNNTNVTFPYTVTDSGSGVKLSSGNVTISTEGSSVTGSVTVSDTAGNSATFTTPAVRIDKTAPVITAAQTPLPNANGWNNTAVTVGFSCTDALSGVASVSNPVTVATSGTRIPASGTCTDLAGNSAIATLAVNIDLVPPTVTITSPANNSVVTIGSTATMQFTCADTLSGIASCTGTPANGAALDTSLGTHSVSATATDKAGNTTTVTSTYTVTYKFVGFQTPLATAGTVTNPTFSGAFNLGKALPIKWDLYTANNVLITDLGTLKLMTATQNTNCKGPATGPGQFILFSPTAGATGGSTFRSSSSGYIFNWDTTSVSAGCWNLILTNSDGSSYSTIVKLQ